MPSSFRHPLDAAFIGPIPVGHLVSATQPITPEAPSLSPLPTGPEFWTAARANGFTPEEAKALHAERESWSQHWAAPLPLERAWQGPWKEALFALRSPLAWRRYLAHRARWIKTLRGDQWPHGTFYPVSAQPSEPVETWEAWLAARPTVPRIPLTSPRPLPRGWTAPIGKALLARLLVREGLRGISWLGAGDEAATSWALYEGLRRACRQWRQVSGWNLLPWESLSQHRQLLSWLVLYPEKEGRWEQERTGLPIHPVAVQEGEDVAFALTRCWLVSLEKWIALSRDKSFDDKAAPVLRQFLNDALPEAKGARERTLFDPLAQASWRHYFVALTPLWRQDQEKHVPWSPIWPIFSVDTAEVEVVLDEVNHVCRSPSEALRPLDTPRSFIRDAAHNGFSPGEAVALYQEKRLFQQHTLLAWNLPEPRWHRDIRQEVSAIRSPEDWRIYLKHWDALASWMKQNKGVSPWAKMVSEALCDAGAWEEDIGGPLSYERRKAHMTVMPTLPHWVGGWTWALAKKVIEPDWAPTKSVVRPRPHRWTAEHGLTCLQRCLRHVGLSAIQWPWSRQDVAEVTWQLFCELRQFHQGLVRQTGWRGPVTGLGRGIWLRLGHDSLDSGGGYAYSGGSLPLICAAWSHWKITVAHEWMHILDAWINRDRRCLWNVSRLSSVSSHPHWAVVMLLDHLKHDTHRPTDAQAWMEDWRGHNGFGRPMLDQRINDWSRAQSACSWRAFYRMGFFDKGRHVLRRRNISTSTLPWLVHLSNHPEWSPWWTRCDELSKEEIRWSVRAKDDPYSWWKQASERLAVAFEGHVLPIQSHQVWYAPGLPTPEELTHHRPIWETFFALLRPEWKSSVAQMKEHDWQRTLENQEDAPLALPRHFVSLPPLPPVAPTPAVSPEAPQDDILQSILHDEELDHALDEMPLDEVLFSPGIPKTRAKGIN